MIPRGDPAVYRRLESAWVHIAKLERTVKHLTELVAAGLPPPVLHLTKDESISALTTLLETEKARVAELERQVADLQSQLKSHNVMGTPT